MKTYVHIFYSVIKLRNVIFVSYLNQVRKLATAILTSEEMKAINRLKYTPKHKKYQVLN